MRFPRSLNSRLVLSHLAVALVSILAMSLFSARYIFNAAFTEAEHNLQARAYVVSNAIEMPSDAARPDPAQTDKLNKDLSNLFADTPDLQYTLYKGDGFPIVDSSGKLPPRANEFNAPEVIRVLNTNPERSTDMRDDARGVHRMYIAVPVQREVELAGVLRVSIPLAPTYAAARQSFLVLALAALGIGALVSLAGWFLARNLARPITVLTRAAQDMEHGDLSIRVRPAGPQELRSLAEAFNKMANRLQTNVNELRAFVANASHELRTPLTVVKLRTEALREGALEEPEVAVKFLTEIETEVDRLVRMVNDLLDLSRMEAGLVGSQRAAVDVRSVAQEVFETFKIRAQRARINFSLDAERGLPPIRGNEDQLRRLLYNLVENAIKYTPQGGLTEVLLRAGPNPNTIRLLVRDNGPGIAPEHLPHVFERFYRAETSAPKTSGPRGSGLGLAIARSIVESHDGEIGVSSQLGNGTTFWADFPRMA